MRDSLKRLRPDRFEDIIAMVSLYRPGPMDNIPTYINRKHGVEQPDYLHPRLEPVLRETHGVIIYQEQVQQIAKELAGYSLGEADLLRRAMGKKIKEEMAAQRKRFVEGAKANGVDPGQAEFIFDLVDKFAGYGFNKSHAAAYALIAYQTAWLKANHPREFIAASMTLDMANTDKLAMFTEEARRLGIAMAPPSINASMADFVPEGERIRYALAALKNVGLGVVEMICRERETGGHFADLGDFGRRIDAQGLNRRTLETIAASGAFDELYRNRAVVHANAENILALAGRTAADRKAGQNDLFGAGGTPDPLQLRQVRAWTPIEALGHEFDAVGFYLTGHPLDEYQSILAKLGAIRWTDFEARVLAGGARNGLLAGIVTMRKERRSKSGNRFAFAGFSDQTGQFETVMFSDVLADAGDLLEIGTAVLVHVEADKEEDTVRLRALLVQSLDKAAGGVRKGLRLTLEETASWSELKGMLEAGGGGRIEVLMRLQGTGREVALKLPGRYDISPARASLLKTVRGVSAVAEL